MLARLPKLDEIRDVAIFDLLLIKISSRYGRIAASLSYGACRINCEVFDRAGSGDRRDPTSDAARR